MIEQELTRVLKSKVIAGLDGVRTLAILLVLADHFLLTDRIGIHHAFGPLGVTIFFVLSGFLITSMLLKEYRRTGTVSLSNFYRRRAYRIFPTFYCCWLLTSLVDLTWHIFDWKAAVASFFYFMDYWRAFGPADSPVQMYISWSLAIEEKFYLLWPLLFLFLLRTRSSPMRILSVIILGQWMYRVILFLGFHVRGSYMYYAFDMRADALLVGCLLAMLLENEATRAQCRRLLTHQWLAVAPPAFLLWAAYATPILGHPALTLLWSAQPLVVAVMLVQAMYWGAKTWKVCSSWIVRTIAHLSYALYLYQPLASRIVGLKRLPHIGITTAILTVIMSVASYYLIEKPFMRIRDLLPGGDSLAWAVEQN